MLVPSIFGENLFDDDWMDFPFDRDFWGRGNTKATKNLMKTDIREHDAGYELDIDLPGYKKDEIRAELENGYLTISATKSANNDEQDKKGKYIRRIYPPRALCRHNAEKLLCGRGCDAGRHQSKI